MTERNKQVFQGDGNCKLIAEGSKHKGSAKRTALETF